MILLATFISYSAPRMKIDTLFKVAVESNLNREAESAKFLNFGGQNKNIYRECRNLCASERELEIHRIAIGEWNYPKYYINA